MLHKNLECLQQERIPCSQKLRSAALALWSSDNRLSNVIHYSVHAKCLQEGSLNLPFKYVYRLTVDHEEVLHTTNICRGVMQNLKRSYSGKKNMRLLTRPEQIEGTWSFNIFYCYRLPHQSAQHFVNRQVCWEMVWLETRIYM